MDEVKICYAGHKVSPILHSYEVHMSEHLARITEAPQQIIRFDYSKHNCRPLAAKMFDTSITKEQVLEMFNVAQCFLTNDEWLYHKDPVKARGIVEMFLDLYVAAEWSPIEDREKFRKKT